MRCTLLFIGFLCLVITSKAQSLQPCTDSLRTSNLGMQVAWSSHTSFEVGETSTPAVGNLNPAQDSIAEIIVFGTKSWSTLQSNKMLIFKGDGSNWAAPSELPLPVGVANGNLFRGSPSLADLDGNGVPELILLCVDKKIRVFTGFDPAANPVMSLWVTSQDTCLTGQLMVYAADLDQDGISELYAGSDVFELDLSTPATPVLRRRLRGTGPIGRMYTPNPTPLGVASSFAADLLTEADCGGDPDCAGLEIAAGHAIYSIDLDPNDGDGYQMKIQRNINGANGQQFYDGLTSVADMDLDGIQEILVTSAMGLESNLGFYVWNKTGFNHFFPSSDIGYDPQLAPYTTGPMLAVGNVFDDRKKGFVKDYPELIAQDNTNITCFNLQKAQLNPANPSWWKQPNGEFTTPSIFDFDGNGRDEIITESDDGVYVLYGDAAPFPPGVTADRHWMTSFNPEAGNQTTMPIVADADGDGQAEIVTVGTDQNNGGYQDRPYVVYVLEADEINHSTWTSARQTWNQYAHAIVHVEDDLGIPQVQGSGHVELPPGSDKHPLNVFSAQTSYYGYEHPRHLVTADASIAVVEVVCMANLKFSVRIRVCNNGSIAFPPSLPITIYRNGNPALGMATSMGTYTLSSNGLRPGACEEITVVLPFVFNNLYAVANDPAIGIFPLVNSDQYWKAECDYTNNIAQFKLDPVLGPSLTIGQDIHDCTLTPHLIQASPGFSSYLWQNGSTNATFIATSPGMYWVEAKDFCFNTKRDTIEISIDTALQHLQTAVCAGAFFQFNGQQLPAGSTQSFVFTNTYGCDSTVVVQVGTIPADQSAESVSICPGDSVLLMGSFVKTAGTFAQNFQNAQGCDSTHTVTVALFPEPIPSSEIRQICPGDSTLVFGNFVHLAGTVSQTFSNANGCDSTHTITVNLFPEPLPSTEIRQICPGDSTLVFGNFVHAAGSFSEIFSNANGCDSTHTITVNLFPETVPSTEIRQICPGDSILVFGNFVHAAGLFSEIFSNANGCDSTHTITVNLFPETVPSSEIQQICPGDSTLVFGNFVHGAGSFSERFSNANGCDSTHTITVNLFPEPVPGTEIQQICPGDSILVFGNFVHGAGSFSESFSNANGCDSTHTITVNLFPTSVPSTEIRQICLGDSTLVFGNFVHTAGLFSEVFSNVNGCDSTHIITVNLFPTSVPSTEIRQICPGDSILVFGNFVHGAGSFSHAFANSDGCDSVHTIRVELLPGPAPTSESRQICPGDSTFIFGQFVKAAGSYVQGFSSQSGCDSIHTITVAVFALPAQSEESRQICAGDSTLVFGSYVHAAGTFAQVFTNNNGCDSTHTIVVDLLPVPSPTSEIRQLCPGDSILLFGNFVHLPGIYTGAFSSIHGCDSIHTVEIIETDLYTRQDSVTLCPNDSIVVFGKWVYLPGVIQEITPGLGGCDTLWTIEVLGIVPPAIDISVIQPDAHKETGKIELAAVAGTSYSLDSLHFDGQTVFDSLSPGVHVVYQEFKGCLTEKTIEIIPFLEADTDQIFAPNIFTPGSPNGNDAFTLYAAPGKLSQVLWLQIYDRWGSLVFAQNQFAPNDGSKGWNGLIHEKTAAPGVYFWQAMVEYSNGESRLIKGDLTLIR